MSEKRASGGWGYTSTGLGATLYEDGGSCCGRAPERLTQPSDAHYAALRVQPIECVEAWLPTWDHRVGYHLGEAVANVARCGTKGQAVRDLRKASWLLSRAADILEHGEARPAMETSPSRTP